MDWLPVVSVIGLSVAVLVLGWTVSVLTARSKRKHGPSEGRQLRQEHLGPSQRGSTIAKEIDRPASVHSIGFRNPRMAFMDAFMKGDTQFAIAILPELRRMLGSENQEYLLSAGALAAVGAQIDLQPLLSAIESNDISDETVLQAIIVSVVQHYVSLDREQEGLDRTKEVLERYIHDVSRSKGFRAAIANQLQMLYLGVEEIDNALGAINLAIELSPDDPSYYFNLSTIYEKREDLEKAIKAIERCMDATADAPDPVHLIQAWDLYRKLGNEEKVKAMRNRLDAVGYRGQS